MSSMFVGGCACGAVRFRALGTPKRAGLCHCRTCQKVHGAAFNAFVVFDAARVQLAGDLVRWHSSPEYARLHCAVCGSRIGGLNGAEIELSLPLFDTPAAIVPEYESWTSRRFAWESALPVPQYTEHRVEAFPG